MHFHKGRSDEQIRKLISALTDAVVDTVDAPRRRSGSTHTGNNVSAGQPRTTGSNFPVSAQACDQRKSWFFGVCYRYPDSTGSGAVGAPATGAGPMAMS
jgi:hypothetical protein